MAHIGGIQACIETYKGSMLIYRCVYVHVHVYVYMHSNVFCA